MNESNALKVGDVVELKSGGPKMTVAILKGGNWGDKIACQWFVGHKLESGLFAPESLKLATSEEK